MTYLIWNIIERNLRNVRVQFVPLGIGSTRVRVGKVNRVIQGVGERYTYIYKKVGEKHMFTSLAKFSLRKFTA